MVAAVQHEIFIEPITNRKYIQDHFIYSAKVESLIAGASASKIINIEANAPFVWMKTAYFASIANAAQTDSTRVIPLVEIGLTDSGSGTNLQNIPVPLSTLAGHEGLPLNLSQPRVFSANSNISITFTNYDATATYTNLYLNFIGYRKLYQ